jgi:phage baseplate assembly protein gpV
LIQDFRQDGGAPRYFGVYPAIVTNIVDPDNLGRIEVSFPWLGSDGDSVRGWATLITPYADDDQGFEMLPSVDTQVVVAFEAGDSRRPYGATKVTLSMRSGHKLSMDDAANEIELTHANGCTIKFTAGGQIEITANATVEVTASTVNVHAPVANFDGIINCTTLIASSGVVSPSYTPGAGNIW